MGDKWYKMWKAYQDQEIEHIKPVTCQTRSPLRITLPLFEIMLRTAVKPSHRIFSVPEGLGVQAAIAQAAISYR